MGTRSYECQKCKIGPSNHGAESAEKEIKAEGVTEALLLQNSASSSVPPAANGQGVTVAGCFVYYQCETDDFSKPKAEGVAA